MKAFYQLKTNDDNAELYIYGDIASDAWKWSDSDVSANDIINELQGVNAKNIDVYINSYGGEVSQGLAIYNALKRHGAKITTYVDAFACSIASVIAMAGDVRKMYDNSLLMIHNAWTVAQGNAAELEKAAEDLKVINAATKKAYLEVINISESKLTELLDAETWLTAEQAVEMGFATEVIAAKKPVKASASAQDVIYNMVTKAAEQPPETDEEPEESQPEQKTDVESSLADIAARVEKLEKEVFKVDEQEEQPAEEKTDEQPATEKVNYMEKFINSIMK
jgi:ATP-dependent Clp protease protease subunit